MKTPARYTNDDMPFASARVVLPLLVSLLVFGPGTALAAARTPTEPASAVETSGRVRTGRDIASLAAPTSIEVWDGNGTNNSWTTNDNWAGLGGVGPGDDLQFPGGANRRTNNNDFPVNTSFNSINFTNPGAVCGIADSNCNYVITGNQIFLVDGILTNHPGTQAIFSPNIILAASQSFLNLTNNGTGPFTLNGVVNLNGHILTVASSGPGGAGSIRMNGLITGTGTLVKNGAGTLFLAGNSPGFGITVINEGGVRVDGTLGNVQLSSGRLLGAGTVGALDASLPAGPNDGIVSPGLLGASVPGILTTSGSIQFAATSTFEVNLDGATVGSQYDRLNVTSGSSVQLNGANLDVTLGFTPSVGQQFTIIQIVGAGSIIGQFAQGTSILVNGQIFGITYNSQSVVLTKQAQSNLGISVTDNRKFVRVGEALTTIVSVTNSGPNDSPTNTVASTLPSELSGGAWICVALGGATCAAGSGSTLSDTPNMPVGGQVSYSWTTTVQPGSPDDAFAVTATVAVGGTATDPAPANNTSTDAPGDIIVIFKNGFDGPATVLQGLTDAGGYAQASLRLDADLLAGLGVVPTVVAIGEGSQGGSLFRIELARFGADDVLRLVMPDEQGVERPGAWQVVALERGLLDLAWQAASALATDGYLRVSVESLDTILAERWESEGLARLRVPLKHGRPALRAVSTSD